MKFVKYITTIILIVILFNLAISVKYPQRSKTLICNKIRITIYNLIKANKLAPNLYCNKVLQCITLINNLFKNYQDTNSLYEIFKNTFTSMLKSKKFDCYFKRIFDYDYKRFVIRPHKFDFDKIVDAYKNKLHEYVNILYSVKDFENEASTPKFSFDNKLVIRFVKKIVYLFRLIKDKISKLPFSIIKNKYLYSSTIVGNNNSILNSLNSKNNNINNNKILYSPNPLLFKEDIKENSLLLDKKNHKLIVFVVDNTLFKQDDTKLILKNEDILDKSKVVLKYCRGYDFNDGSILLKPDSVFKISKIDFNAEEESQDKTIYNNIFNHVKEIDPKDYLIVKLLCISRKSKLDTLKTKIIKSIYSYSKRVKLITNLDEDYNNHNIKKFKCFKKIKDKNEFYSSMTIDKLFSGSENSFKSLDDSDLEDNDLLNSKIRNRPI